MMTADILFRMMMNVPELSNLPTCLPAKAREKNQIHDTAMQASAKASLSIPE
ncbi:hypothetical protein D3C84_1310410 [compost metagenome]